MFQPSGPNFFLSWMIAWKKQIPNTSLRHVTPRTVEKSKTHAAKQLNVSLKWESFNRFMYGARDEKAMRDKSLCSVTGISTA